MKQWIVYSLVVLGFGFCASSPIKKKPKVKWGIATITWGDAYLKGIEEIGSLGVKGIQIRGNVFQAYKDKPGEFKALLKKYKLEAPILSGGDVRVEPDKRVAQLEKFKEMARFVKAIKGKYLQATTQSRDAYPPGKDKLLALSAVLNEIGEACAAEGVTLLLHNHMHQYCQTPEELDLMLANTDPKKVGLLLDIAHYAQAGGKPADAIRKYKKRLELLHIKDVLSPKPGHSGSEIYNYLFVELGKGNKVNLDETMEALAETSFKGWCMIELDAVPSKQDSPLKATQTSLDYLTSRYGYRF